MRFEWDFAKDRINKRKHGISFDDASNVFFDAFAQLELDQVDATGEARWRIIGMIAGTLTVVVVHALRQDAQGEVIRIISARQATRMERSLYEQARHENFD